MNEEEKFDELLSSKLSERDFPFDELNWDKAERLIAKQDRWKKAGRFFLIFSAGVMAGIAALLFFIPKQNSSLSVPMVSKLAINQAAAVKSGNIVSGNKAQNNIGTHTIESKENTSPPVQSAFVKKNNSAGVSATPFKASPLAGKEQKDLSVLARGEGVANQQGKKKEGHKSSVLAAVVKESDNTVVHKEVVRPKESNSDKQTVVETTVQVKNISTSKTENVSGNSTPINKDNAPHVLINKSNSAESSQKNTVSVDSKTSSVKAKKDSAKANSPPLPTPPVASPYVNSNNYPLNIFSVFDGGSYSLGWNNNGAKQANGINPVGGFEYTRYFTEAISVSAGIGYLELNKLNETYTGSVIEYDFGAVSSITTVTPQKVYYFAIPVSVQYNIDDNDKIGIGCNYLILLTTANQLATYQKSYFSQTTASTSMQNGYTQGFSNTVPQISLTYTRMITNRLGISIEYCHDLSYVENNTMTGLNQNTKNSDFGLVLSYQLMK